MPSVDPRERTANYFTAEGIASKPRFGKGLFPPSAALSAVKFLTSRIMRAYDWAWNLEPEWLGCAVFVSISMSIGYVVVGFIFGVVYALHDLLT